MDSTVGKSRVLSAIVGYAFSRRAGQERSKFDPRTLVPFMKGSLITIGQGENRKKGESEVCHAVIASRCVYRAQRHPNTSLGSYSSRSFSSPDVLKLLATESPACSHEP